MNNNILSLLALAIYFYSCSGFDCKHLPNTYSSYESALKTIKTTHFNLRETTNTSKSSWIKGASYYSCDGSSGYLIVETYNQEYLHSNVPVNIWVSFKNSNSFGNYYNHNIKNNFPFYLE